MKICVTSTGPSPDAPVDMRFGRCQYFVIVDSETMEYGDAKPEHRRVRQCMNTDGTDCCR